MGLSPSFDDTTRERERLESIGFNSLIAALLARLPESTGGSPGKLRRICECHGDHALIHDSSASHSARVMPALLRHLAENGHRLVVGDWVIARDDDNGDWWIHERLAPYTELHRIDPGGERQALVSNVDCAFLVMALDGDFNLRRLERYLALAKSSGVLPVIVLTKADLCLNIDSRMVDSRMDELRARLPSSVDRHAMNARDPAATKLLMPYLQRGQTAVLLGSSGAGKSTLTNTLAGEVRQATATVRESDSRGRHTTTSRTLHQLPGGACLIDTPGLRGLRLDIDAAALQELFEDIDALAKLCRFRDCAHESEPGCAVRDSVPADRLANFHKLGREIARERADVFARQAQKGYAKTTERAIRSHYRLNPGKK